MKRRHRRRYMTEQQKTANMKPVIRGIIGVLCITGLLLYTGNWILDYFGAGNTIRRIGTTVTLENAGNANVSIEGSEMKRAENGQKLYPGDRIVTSSASEARLSFFDTSVIRMNEQSDVYITETYHGAEESNISIRLQEGMLWVQTPEKQNFSGAIARVIHTPAMTVNIPPNTEALVQPRSIVVYSADGLGVTIEADEAIVPVIVGEGQKFTLPPDAQSSADLYAYRSPLDPMAVQNPFVEASRAAQGTVVAQASSAPTEGDSLPPVAPEDGILSIVSPAENAVIDTATVTVRGRVGKSVARVRVNGYNAVINNGSFTQELALPNEDTIDIIVLALAADGTTLREVSREVSRNRTPPPSPTITSPAGNGATYTTNQTRLEIRGTAPEGTVGIIVNDYRLQLFEPGNTTWKYLASTNIDNYSPGENIFRVYAINAGGYKSEPAELTIVLDTGAGESTTESGTTDTADDIDDTSNLPNNAPLQPGSIQVIAPTAGSTHTATESSFLIEGTTPANTATFWINNYRLRLYEAGKTTWNYIADVNMNTLRPGTNTYKATARDADNAILDTFIYTVDFQP